MRRLGGELAVFKRVGIDDALREVTTTLKRTESELREKTRKLAVIAKIEEDPAELMARSPEMRKLMELAKTIAAIDSTVLITGESGTGKERVARFVHDHSAHAAGPFIAVNCGAITETLLESELFGHARGAFTGRHGGPAGAFRGGQRRHAFPGRSRRDHPSHAGQAPSGAPGKGSAAGGGKQKPPHATCASSAPPTKT